MDRSVPLCCFCKGAGTLAAQPPTQQLYLNKEVGLPDFQIPFQPNFVVNPLTPTSEDCQYAKKTEDSWDHRENNHEIV